VTLLEQHIDTGKVLPVYKHNSRSSQKNILVWQNHPFKIWKERFYKERQNLTTLTSLFKGSRRTVT